MQKISLDTIGKGAVFACLVGLLLVNTRIILENMLHAQDIDQRIVSEASPRLNRNLLRDAVTLLDSFISGDLTAISSSDTVELKQSTPSGSISLEIQNASGVTGAAASVAELLKTRGYQVSAISTAPSQKTETSLFYRAGQKETAQRVAEILESQEWRVALMEEKEQKPDIVIMLGKS